ncbi:hypothetical protein G4B88_031520 [Cannabis sativa]|uniref:Uncharacterized protein n=1 Tax=Cannabis sativa TaxID=3483 RepID=A0A7J6G4E9_CANSA|nr:hypothetical protein G4B88_031520 [Cannabis sativa]
MYDDEYGMVSVFAIKENPSDYMDLVDGTCPFIVMDMAIESNVNFVFLPKFLQTFSSHGLFERALLTVPVVGGIPEYAMSSKDQPWLFLSIYRCKAFLYEPLDFPLEHNTWFQLTPHILHLNPSCHRRTPNSANHDHAIQLFLQVNLNANVNLIKNNAYLLHNNPSNADKWNVLNWKLSPLNKWNCLIYVVATCPACQEASVKMKNLLHPKIFPEQDVDRAEKRQLPNHQQQVHCVPNPQLPIGYLLPVVVQHKIHASSTPKSLKPKKLEKY